MNSKIWELENLRRQLEGARVEAGMIDEAIERGWIPKDQEEKNRAIQQKKQEVVDEIEPKLKSLKELHFRSKDRVVECWISLHLQVCQNLLQTEINSSNDESGVRIICIGDVLTQLGKMLGPEIYTFWINTCYLSDYDEKFNQIAGS